MATARNAPKACHNCRRQRRKCDRTLPKCLKCAERGQDCLGYQQLLRWEPGVASRGKMMGKCFQQAPVHDTIRAMQICYSTSSSDVSSSSGGSWSLPSTPRSLEEPGLQDLNYTSRKYVHYFARNVCKDLVLYDAPGHNPFHELIPLAFYNPALLQVIVANSALHMSNAYLASTKQPLLACGPPDHPHSTTLWALESVKLNQTNSFADALAAKQATLHLLRDALHDNNPANFDAILAVILLLIEFELLDSRQGHWKRHLLGAQAIIKSLCGTGTSTQQAKSGLRSTLIANCVMVSIIGSTTSKSHLHESDDIMSKGTLALLQDAEGNICSSFPVVLLRLVQNGTHLLQSCQADSYPNKGDMRSVVEARKLIAEAHSFDPLAWATAIQQRSPVADLAHRRYVAAAHRAATCVYLSRVLSSLCPDTDLQTELQQLVAEIVSNLSHIRPPDALFPATTWPTFIAGVETQSFTTQAWATQRFQELWEVEHWGVNREALSVLQSVWAKRREAAFTRSDHKAADDSQPCDDDWIRVLMDMGVDWLII